MYMAKKAPLPPLPEGFTNFIPYLIMIVEHIVSFLYRNGEEDVVAENGGGIEMANRYDEYRSHQWRSKQT